MQVTDIFKFRHTAGHKKVTDAHFCASLDDLRRRCIIRTSGEDSPENPSTEVITMSLANFAEWNEEKTAAACGASCGAADKPAACGAADKPEEKPAACGASCGAGDK